MPCRAGKSFEQVRSNAMAALNALDQSLAILKQVCACVCVGVCVCVWGGGACTCIWPLESWTTLKALENARCVCMCVSVRAHANVGMHTCLH